MIRAIVFCLMMLLLGACTKTIDVNLNSVAKKFVIEGNITDAAGGCRVVISETKDFNTDNNFPGISGAMVSITDAAGIVTMLSESAAGVYEAPALVGVSRNTYTLRVNIGDQEYSAQSTLPERTGLDSVFVTSDAWAGEVWKLANIAFMDDPDTENFYLFTQYINGKKREELYYMSDEYANGKEQVLKLYMFTDTKDEDRIKSGDQVVVKMMCIDKNMYKYWYSAAQSVTSHSQSAAPSNPVTNMKGGALGYFSAQTVDQKSIVVQ